MKTRLTLYTFTFIFLFVSISGAFNLDKFLLKSVGGKKGLESIKNMKSMHYYGTAQMGSFKGSFEHLFVMPNKIYTKVDLPGLSIQQIYDGEKAFKVDYNGQTTEMSGSEKASLLNDAYFESYSYLFDDRLPGGYEYIMDSTIDKTKYHIVSFYPYNCDTVTVFYEASTAHEILSVTREDMMRVITINDQFKTRHDIIIPMYSKMGSAETKFDIWVQLDTVLYNQQYDESIFNVQAKKAADFHFPNNSDSVNILIDYKRGHIKVPVIINGVKHVVMILDSGASSNIFNSPVLRGLDLEIVGEIPSAGIGGFENVSLIKSDSVQIGKMTLYNQVAGTLDLGLLAEAFNVGKNFGGLLGYDFISRFPIMIDYDLGVMTVYNPNKFQAPPGGIEVPFHLTMQIPTVSATLNGFKGNFIIDLGNSMGLFLQQSFAQNEQVVKSLHDFDDSPLYAGGIGGALKGQEASAALLQIGDMFFNNIQVFVPDSGAGLTESEDMDGIIGNKILEQTRLLFDYHNNRIIFYPKQ